MSLFFDSDVAFIKKIDLSRFFNRGALVITLPIRRLLPIIFLFSAVASRVSIHNKYRFSDKKLWNLMQIFFNQNLFYPVIF